jgi:hypothetical protein
MERPPRPPCLVCYELIEDVEKHLFEKHDSISALEKIKAFFLSIHIPAAGAAEDAPNASRYTELTECKIPDTLIISPERIHELKEFAKIIHANTIVTCSVYIENVLLLILNNTDGVQFDDCVKLIIDVPMEVRFKNFMEYSDSDPDTKLSGPIAMNNFRSFMSLSYALIMKKIDIPILEQEKKPPNLRTILSFLQKMHWMILTLLLKIDNEMGSGGIDIEVVSEWFAKTIELKETLETKMQDVIMQLEREIAETKTQDVIMRLEGEIAETKTKLFELRENTNHLITNIDNMNQRITAKSRPGTPQRQIRQGGGSKSKKYKKKISKSKKYKNKISKSKKYKKNNSKSKKYKKLLF